MSTKLEPIPESTIKKLLLLIKEYASEDDTEALAQIVSTLTFAFSRSRFRVELNLLDDPQEIRNHQVSMENVEKVLTAMNEIGFDCGDHLWREEDVNGKDYAGHDFYWIENNSLEWLSIDLTDDPERYATHKRHGQIYREGSTREGVLFVDDKTEAMDRFFKRMSFFQELGES